MAYDSESDEFILSKKGPNLKINAHVIEDKHFRDVV